MEAKVAQHYFEFSNRKYFRGKAENVRLGSYGEKKDPIGPDAFLEVQNKIRSEHLQGHIQKIPSVKIDWGSTTAATVETNGLVQYFILNAKQSLAAKYEKVKSAKLELVKLFISEGPLKTILNNEAGGCRNYLAHEGGDGRVVSEIWVAVAAELAEHFNTSGTLSSAVSAAVSGVAADVDITATGGKYGTQTITLSSGTTFAYLLHKVKDWNKDKTKIENLEGDYQGLQ